MALPVALATAILALQSLAATAIRDSGQGDQAAHRESTPTVTSEDSDVHNAPSILPTQDTNQTVVCSGALKPYSTPSSGEISSGYIELGCFDLEEHDPGNEGGKVALLDSYCRDFKCNNNKYQGQKCRSGLPFFRRPLKRGAQAFAQCMDFCLQSGLDVFGLVDRAIAPPPTIECRCGASGHNTQIWQEVNDRQQATCRLGNTSVDWQRQGSAKKCIVRIGMYDPEWMKQHNHGTPTPLLKRSVATVRYIGHILRGTRQPLDDDEAMIVQVQDIPEFMWLYDEPPTHHSLLENEVQRQHGIDKMKRFDCSNGRCAAGEAWGPQIKFAFTKEVDGIRVEAYKLALSKIAAKVPCLAFVEFHCMYRPSGRCFESDFQGANNQAGQDSVLLIGNREPKDDSSRCYSAGVGFPGQYRMRFINLGGSCSSQVHHGEMMHVTLIALGVGHMDRRPDAHYKYPWGGPFLEVDWEQVRKSSAVRWKKNVALELTEEQLALKVESDVLRFKPNENSYIGSAARGAYAPFDYKSITMPGASPLMKTNRRRGSQVDIPGCSKRGCLDRLTGQRSYLSDQDVLQLRDLYGCLPLIEGRCPALYGGGKADEQGNCACPAETTCYNGNTKGCPFHVPGVHHENFFAANCSSCRCVAMSCPANAETAIPAPTGDCSCRDATQCWQGGRRGCVSSRSNRDIQLFSGSCVDCRCVAKCPVGSNALHVVVDANGDCQCRQNAVCKRGSVLGCISSIGFSTKYFSPAQCLPGTCTCEDVLEPHSPTCSRDNGDGVETYIVDSSPEEMGDCECQVNAVCQRAGGFPCPYSGGLSRRYFLATCVDCSCLSRGLWFQPLGKHTPMLQRREMNEMCATGEMPAKCGATMLRIGDDVVSLSVLDLGLNECGRCIFAQPTGGRDGQQWSSCQQSTRGFSLEMRYTLVDSGPTKDLCCAKHACDAEYSYNQTAPCTNYRCVTNNAICKEEHSNSGWSPKCLCATGYELSDDKEECVPMVPEDSRCCGFENAYMWVPPQHLQVQTFLGQATGKSICPKIKQQKWKHATDDNCDKRDKKERFIYQGDGKTP